ncbi:hypothetical protein IWW38_006101 [Coemansia aciculifera]|uniref:Uncharacterized protein n=1 Tax=Coemansia aciculifera TaxID=417176 RepID=A0ACC1LTC4_9FUNG|nr:hypothetical protein IWW38_006101 [Coemansia aciculifera]
MTLVDRRSNVDSDRLSIATDDGVPSSLTVSAAVLGDRAGDADLDTGAAETTDGEGEEEDEASEERRLPVQLSLPSCRGGAIRADGWRCSSGARGSAICIKYGVNASGSFSLAAAGVGNFGLSRTLLTPTSTGDDAHHRGDDGGCCSSGVGSWI